MLCWKTSVEQDIQLLHRFIGDVTIIELEPEIKIMTAELRKKHRIKLPDAIIAATAIAYSLTLVTRNTDDFRNIPDLNIIDPFSIERDR